MSNPALAPDARERLVKQLMAARRGVREALKIGNRADLASARRAVDAAKTKLGERGAVWWTDGAPDLNRRMANKSVYAEWYADIENEGRGEPPRAAEP